MKILIYTQYFYPETNAAANRMTDIAKYLSQKHTVEILTGFPNHPLGKKIGDYKMQWFKREEFQNLFINRSFLIIPKKTNSKLWRYFNYYSFAFSSFINLFRMEKSDVILLTTPPITILILGFIYAKLRKIKMVIDIRDLWPEAAISLKIIKKNFWTNTLEKIVIKGYNYATKIFINTEAFRETLINDYNIIGSKIEYIPNGFNIAENLSFKEPKKDNKEFKIFYSGLFGWAQNVNFIIETAKIFQDKNESVKFVLIGDGPLKNSLKEKAKNYHLNNLEIIDYQKKEDLFKIINGCDLGLITYEINDTFRKNIPSKIFDYMFLEKPALINLKGEASRLMTEGNFGFNCETHDPILFYTKIKEILANSDLNSLGKNGFQYLQDNFDKKDLLEKLGRIIENI